MIDVDQGAQTGCQGIESNRLRESSLFPRRGEAFVHNCDTIPDRFAARQQHPQVRSERRSDKNVYYRPAFKLRYYGTPDTWVDITPRTLGKALDQQLLTMYRAGPMRRKRDNRKAPTRHVKVDIDIPLDVYDRLLDQCDCSTWPWEVLRNGVILPRIEKGFVNSIVRLLCDKKEADALFRLAQSVHPAAAPLIRAAIDRKMKN